MSNTASTESSTRNRSPRPGTSSNTLEVSTADSSGKKINMSVECAGQTKARCDGIEVRRPKKRRYLEPRIETQAADSSDSRPLSISRKSRTTKERPTSTAAVRTVTSKKAHNPRSAKHNKLQHKLRNYVYDSDPDQLRQQLREAQDKNLELEQKLQLKSAEITGSKRRENDLKERERELLGQLRDANDVIKDLEEDGNDIRSRYRTSKRELRSTKVNLEDKETQIRQLEKRLDESTKLLGANLKTMKNRRDPVSPSTEVPQPSTSSESVNTLVAPRNDGNIFEDMLSNFKEMLETQLQCSICNEVYVFSMVISCGHTFCEDCIRTWMTKKMNCPECRAKIESHIPNKVLDSYIDKFIENYVPKGFQVARKVLLEERKKKMDDRTHGPRVSSSNQEGYENIEVPGNDPGNDSPFSDIDAIDDELAGAISDVSSDSSSSTSDLESIEEFSSRRLNINSAFSSDDSLDWHF